MRLGLGIGAVVLAVLVVYVLSTGESPHPANPQGSQDSTLLTQRDATLQSDQQNAAPGDDAARGSDVSAVGDASSGATGGSALADNRSGDSSSTDPAADRQSSFDWVKLLATGEMDSSLQATPDRAGRNPDSGVTALHTPTPQSRVRITPVPPGEMPLNSVNNDNQIAHRHAAESDGAGEPRATGQSAQRTTASRDAVATVRQYTIQTNDTYSTIAASLYGSANYYPHIQRANPNLDPRRLRPGMVINVPDRSQVIPPAGSSQTDDPAAPSASSGRRTDESTPIDPARQYKVQPGDSLYQISVKLYGTGRHVDAIYQKNAQVIGPDKSRLKLETVLELPQSPTVAQAR
jgi:nucleoid-associated protein YgaU